MRNLIRRALTWLSRATTIGRRRPPPIRDHDLYRQLERILAESRSKLF
jgi:hypothetical protein